jgi:hypothetical protein
MENPILEEVLDQERPSELSQEDRAVEALPIS